MRLLRKMKLGWGLCSNREGLTEKGAFEQRLEGTGKKVCRYVQVTGAVRAKALR